LPGRAHHDAYPTAPKIAGRSIAAMAVLRVNFAAKSKAFADVLGRGRTVTTGHATVAVAPWQGEMDTGRDAETGGPAP
jgi:hypothetical protein